MVIAEGHLAIIIKTTRASPTTTLVIDRLRLAQNRMLYSNEDEQTRSICFNTGEYHKHNREERKRVTDDYLQCSSIKVQKQVKRDKGLNCSGTHSKLGKRKVRKQVT